MKNKVKIRPAEFKVLIEPEIVEEKTAGGILLSQMTIDREQMKQVKGILIAIGGNAFEGWNDKPKVGDKVYFGRYTGDIIEGNDGKEYRLINDKDIVAILEE